jgi:Flp pilus assembly protein TadG
MTGNYRRGALAAIVRSCSPRPRRREEAGASLVEFAIVLPVFALMLFAMIQFGLGFAGWDELRNAVQTGARIAANGPTTSPDATCGQVDPGPNMVCQVAFLIGSPIDTNPSLVTSPVQISTTSPSEYGCDTSLTSCSSYVWLDGYYIFVNGQWLQIVNDSAAAGQITDLQAFLNAGLGKWTCTDASSTNCTQMSTNVNGQNQGALGSDNVTISVDTIDNLLEVCAQRQAISFTAFPGLQDIHLSTTSTFYLTSTASVLGIYPSGSTCG